MAIGLGNSESSSSIRQDQSQYGASDQGSIIRLDGKGAKNLGGTTLSNIKGDVTLTFTDGGAASRYGDQISKLVENQSLFSDNVLKGLGDLTRTNNTGGADMSHKTAGLAIGAAGLIGLGVLAFLWFKR